MTLQDIRDYVRAVPDLDSSDLTDAVLDTACLEAYDLIAYSTRNWAFYSVSTTYTTVPTVSSFNLASLSQPLTDVSNIVGNRWVLTATSHIQAVEYFPINITASREPVAWSRVGDTIHLWPTPDGVYSYTIVGQRVPGVWPNGAGSVPDLPSPFHGLIATLALSRAYAQQDDLNQAQLFKGSFNERFEVLRRRYTTQSLPVPVALNEGGRRIEPFPFHGRLRYGWE